MKVLIRTIFYMSWVVGLCLPTHLAAQEKTSKHREINWSVNLASRPDSLKLTWFNLGLITNIDEQRGLGVNVLSSAVHQRMNGVQLAGVLDYASYMNGLQISGLANFVKNGANGMMLSALVNAVGGDAAGFQLSGLTNITGKRFDGLALSGLMNISTDVVNGVQMAGLLNTCGGKVNGLQLSLLGNVGTVVSGSQLCMISNIASDRIIGLQWAGVANIAVNADHAVQLSTLTNVCLDTMKGAQVAIIGNYAEHVEGAQIGLFNIATGKVRGWQVGVVNHSTDTTAHKIGLVNVTPKTKIQAMLFGSNTSKFNVAVRFKNRMNYSILGIGSHYFDMNEDFSGCLFYRTGLYFPLKHKFEISGDLGFFHIEDFEDEDAETPIRLYSLQARVNLSYRILPKLNVFASTGYAMTRYYKKNKLFENKGIIEAGIILF